MTNICECCGQKIRNGMVHHLSRGLVDSLIMFARMLETKGQNGIHLLKESGFSVSRINNFQKLKYFGLVAHGEETGVYVLTTKGKNFLNNKELVPEWIKTFNNQIIERAERIISFKEAKKSPEYWQTEFNLVIENHQVSQVTPNLQNI